MQRARLRWYRLRMRCRWVFFFLILWGCKQTAEVVAEKGVKAAKETAKGLEDGIDKGRKSGESADGALIVSSKEELSGKGAVSVHSVSSGGDASKRTTVTLAVENTTDKPLRLTKLEFSVLDKEGFAKKVEGAPAEVTVLAHAKEKIDLTVSEKPESLSKVRYWGADLPLR